VLCGPVACNSASLRYPWARLPAGPHDYLLPPTTTRCFPRLPAASHRLPAASHDYLRAPRLPATSHDTCSPTTPACPSRNGGNKQATALVLPRETLGPIMVPEPGWLTILVRTLSAGHIFPTDCNVGHHSLAPPGHSPAAGIFLPHQIYSVCDMLWLHAIEHYSSYN
jgi:hypothetical protein